MYVIILNVKGLLNWLHLAEVLFKCLVVVIYLINRSVLRATGTILLYFIYLFTEYPSTEKQQRLPSLHQQSAICASIPSPATVPCCWRKQIPWPHCKPSEPASLESLSWDGICAFTRFKSFQVNLMCCQVRGAQKACLGFLFLNFSIFSIIIAFKVGALLIEREKIVWRKFFSKIEEIRYDIDAEEIILRPSSVPNRESVLSFLVAHLDWAAHRSWIWAG